LITKDEEYPLATIASQLEGSLWCTESHFGELGGYALMMGGTECPVEVYARYDLKRNICTVGEPLELPDGVAPQAIR
jgi:hypothetical protein